MMKRVGAVAGLVVLMGVGALLPAKNVMAGVVSEGIEGITGLESRIGAMQMELFNTAVEIKGLQVLNPPGFQQAIMVDLSGLYVDYKLSSFLKRRPHFERVRLHLQEFHVVRNADGQLNLHAIKALESGEGLWHIDVLEITIGKTVFTDYSQSPPIVKEFVVNIDERYDHITNPNAVVWLLVSRALVRTTIDQLADFDVAGLQRAVMETLTQSGDEH